MLCLDLAMVAGGLHYLSQTHTMFLTSVDKGVQGALQAQRYVQFAKKPGELLFGYRHNVATSHSEEMPFRLLIEKRISPANRNGIDMGERVDPPYWLGFARQVNGNRNAEFYGDYVFVRLWIVEVCSCLGAVLLGAISNLLTIKKDVHFQKPEAQSEGG